VNGLTWQLFRSPEWGCRQAPVGRVAFARVRSGRRGGAPGESWAGLVRLADSAGRRKRIGRRTPGNGWGPSRVLRRAAGAGNASRSSPPRCYRWRGLGFPRRGRRPCGGAEGAPGQIDNAFEQAGLLPLRAVEEAAGPSEVGCAGSEPAPGPSIIPANGQRRPPAQPCGSRDRLGRARRRPPVVDAAAPARNHPAAARLIGSGAAAWLAAVPGLA